MNNLGHKPLSTILLALTLLIPKAGIPAETPTINPIEDSHQSCIDEVVEYLARRNNLCHKYNSLGTGRATRLLNEADYHAAVSSFTGKWEERACRLLLNVAPTTLRIHGLDPGTMALIPDTHCPLLHSLLDDVANRVGIRKPLLFVSDDPLFVNAAAGMITPSVGFVVIGSSALVNFSRRELVGTLAHEFGHIRCNHGPKAFGLALTIIGLGFATSTTTGRYVSSRYGNKYGLTAGLAVYCSSLLFMFWAMSKWSQHCEREADQIEHEITNDPEALISSLRMLDNLADAAYETIPIAEEQLLKELGITADDECDTVLSDSRKGWAHLILKPLHMIRRYFLSHPSHDEREKHAFAE